MERMSRRDFVRFGVVGAGSFVTGRILGELAYPFSDIPFQERPLTREELNDRLRFQGSILIPEDPYAQEPEENIKVTANREVVTHRLFVLLERNQDINLKASAILNKKPLKITLTQKEPPQLTTSAGLSSAGATYTPILKGGPEITIYKNFLTGYYIASKSTDVNSQKAHDAFMFHEFIHFLQDVRDPLRMPINDVWVETNEIINKTGLRDPVNTHDTKLENEAQAIAEEEVFGPFGYLFTFQRH